jgi:hypothetical protein
VRLVIVKVKSRKRIAADQVDSNGAI